MQVEVFTAAACGFLYPCPASSSPLDPSPPVRQQCIGRIFGNASGTACCLLPAALQPRRFCQFSVTLMGLIIFELCSCTVFFSSIFFVFYFTYFVGLTIHKFVFEVGPKGRRQPDEKNHCCYCCCWRYLLLSLQLPLLLL